MKKHRNFLLLLPICFTQILSAFAQLNCDSVKYSKIINNSYACNWQFFRLTGATKGVVIKHEKQTTACGVLATASLTIIKTDTDTIRVINLCNQNDYTVGQKVKIQPKSEPQFQVYIPCSFSKEKVEKENTTEKIRWHSNSFDKSISKTTWGLISME